MAVFWLVLLGVVVATVCVGFAMAARARHMILVSARERANLKQMLQDQDKTKRSSTSHAA